MKTSVLEIAKRSLLMWGGCSLAGGIVLTAYIGYQLGPGNRDRRDSATPRDASFVLNNCELGQDRIKRVVHSYVSSRSFTGDHLDAFAIEISHVELAELTSKTHASATRWYRGDQLPQILDEAVKFVSLWNHDIPWLPSEAALKSADIYVYPKSIYCHGIKPFAAELIFIRPADRMVYFVEGKL